MKQSETHTYIYSGENLFPEINHVELFVECKDTKMTNRLETLQQYLAEAEKHLTKNKLYIEDLKISIEYEKSKNRQKEIMMLEEVIIG
jgi:hypothetical protein